jgi:hypothetical protein
MGVSFLAFMVVIGAGTGISSTQSLLTNASIMTLWNMINGIQVYLMIPLIGPELPENIYNFIIGLDFAMCSFSFVPINAISPFKDI